MRFRIVGLLISLFLIFPDAIGASLELRRDDSADSISVYRVREDKPILTQNFRKDRRPYIHPIVAPDGRGVLTEDGSEGNGNQAGLFWGFTDVNGRDYFTNTGDNYWRRISAVVLKPKSSVTDLNVKWQTVYDLLDENGEAILRETLVWTMREVDEEYILDVEWSGKAMADVTVGENESGGMFLQVPWREAVNSARQSDEGAEGQRAVWLDLSIEVEGGDDLAHIALFDHTKNEGFPQPWRVEKNIGAGPVRARLGDWTIKAGETAVIKHQLRVYTGSLNDVQLTDDWSSYAETSPGMATAQWQLAKKEGREAEFLTPEKALEAMTLKDGFKAQVFASEPMITQPMAFCWDSRGRLWIAENRDYAGRGAGSSFSGESRISILEDTDRDGVADTKKIFLDRVINPSAMAVGLDGLWLGSIPDLLFVPDRDGDDRADVDDIEVRLTGWGNQDMHEIINSLHWGPDGWLYGLQGVFTPSRVGKPGGKSAVYQSPKDVKMKPREQAREAREARGLPDVEYAGETTDINGGVWRYHPTKDRFEVVAHGVSNPWGIDYDAKGQILISACVIPHLWHIVPGGLYHRQAGSHFNKYAYSDIRTIGDHRHRSAHGGARVYLSDAFPDEYYGQLFMGNIHEHAVLTDRLERKGSGFVGHHGEDFMHANNAQFVGFSTEIGPDGAIYMLDWHDADICGDVVRTKDTGRVFRIAPEESNAKNWDGRYDDLRKLTDAQLVNLQSAKSAWHARRARIILQNRAIKDELDPGTHHQLYENFKTRYKDGDHRLRAMWALHVTQGFTEITLIEALNDHDEYIRAWAIQMLCEDKDPTRASLENFAEMAVQDDSPVVRLYLASALQRMDVEKRMPIARSLVAHAEDAGDHNIPKVLWYGLEPLVEESADQGIELIKASDIPIITQYIARRMTDGDRMTELVDEIQINAGKREMLLLGMRDGLDGRNDAEAPANWAKAYDALRDGNEDIAKLALQLSLQFGDAVAAQALVATLANGDSSLEDRQQAIRGLAARKREELKPQLIALFADDALRPDAIRAVASYDDVSLAEALLERYANFSSADKLEVVYALSSRPDSGTLLMNAIEIGDVPRRDVPAYIARLLFRVVGNRFLEVWGPVDDQSEDIEAAFAKYNALLTEEALAKGNPRRGREVYTNTCFACHQMYGEGGQVGPDLTGANRTDLNYLLGNILTPSAIILDDYKLTNVFTTDGQVHWGILISEDDRQVQLRVANVDELITVPKSLIEEQELTDMSMMPEGLLDNLSDAEVIDLVAFLRSLEPVYMQEASN
ncbi:MAG: PVC-type heme-binding CxxCH protein [Candidatus Hydrogenedentota bacterium]